MSGAGRAEFVLALSIAGGILSYTGTLLLRGPPARHPVQVARMMAALDVDGSGALEAPELEGRDPPGESWHLHDLDADGRLGPREIEVALDELDPRWLLRLPD